MFVNQPVIHAKYAILWGLVVGPFEQNVEILFESCARCSSIGWFSAYKLHFHMFCNKYFEILRMQC